MSLGDLLAFRDSLTGQLSTRNRRLIAVKSLLSFAQQTGYLPFNVGAALPLHPIKTTVAERILDEAEVARLIDRTTGRNHAHPQALLRLRNAGLRALRAEVARSVGSRRCRPGHALRQGREDAGRLDPAKTWAVLQELRGHWGEDDPVFRSRKNGHLTSSQVRRIIVAAARAAGLSQKVSPHWLRHCHATHALDRNAPLHLVQQTLGHASIATTGKYLHVRPTESSSNFLPD